MHGCASKARRERELFPEIREEKTRCYPREYNYFKTCTPRTAQRLLYKSQSIIRQKSNLSLCAVICLFLLFPTASCRGTVVQAHCVSGEYSPLPRYVRCQLRHSNFLKVIIESHNVFKHEFTTKSSYERDDISPQQSALISQGQ